MHEPKDKTFDLVVSIFGAMFAPCGQSARDAIGRPDRHGKVDSEWSHVGSAGFEDQRLVFPGRRNQPMTWGIESSNVLEQFAAAGVPKERIYSIAETRTISTFPAAIRARWWLPKIPWTNDDLPKRLAGRRGSATEPQELFKQSEQEPEQRCYFHPRDFLRGLPLRLINLQ
jgi:hypothetical protein